MMGNQFLSAAQLRAHAASENAGRSPSVQIVGADAATTAKTISATVTDVVKRIFDGPPKPTQALTLAPPSVWPRRVLVGGAIVGGLALLVAMVRK